MFISHQKGGNPFLNVDMRVVNRSGSAVTLNQLVAFQFNLDSSSGTSDEAKGGGPGVIVGTGAGISTGSVDVAPYPIQDGIFANIVAAANSAENTGQMLGVVNDLLNGGGADNTEVQVRLQGQVTVTAASANYDVGDPLMKTAAAASLSAADLSVAGTRIVAYSLSEEDSATQIEAMFFGWANGLGNGNS